MFAILATLVEGLHLQRPIRPRLPAAAAARLPAAAVAPLLAAAPFPASAAVSHHLAGPLSDVTLALASRGDGSEGLLASITRDPTDVYYLVLVLIGLFYVVKNVADRDDLEPPSVLALTARLALSRTCAAPAGCVAALTRALPKQVGSAVVEEARDFDRRGELANRARADFKKRERADRRDKVRVRARAPNRSPNPNPSPCPNPRAIARNKAKRNEPNLNPIPHPNPTTLPNKVKRNDPAYERLQQELGLG